MNDEVFIAMAKALNFINPEELSMQCARPSRHCRHTHLHHSQEGLIFEAHLRSHAGVIQCMLTWR